MARRELGIWRRLNHPNIVPFLGIATGFGVFGSKSLVSLWMRNGTLESFLEKYEKNLKVEHRLQLVGSLILYPYLFIFSSNAFRQLLDVANGLHYRRCSLSMTIIRLNAPDDSAFFYLQVTFFFLLYSQSNYSWRSQPCA